MISVVIPVFNEEENIPTLVTRLGSAAAKWGDSFEVILVDDGSKDRTLKMLREVSKRDPRFRYLSFSRNFGHQTAVSAGLTAVRGEVAVIMDADLQDPPEVVNQFLDKWREGYEVVYAVRQKRKESILKVACYWAFYRFLRKMSSIQIPLDSGDFCVMDRKVIDHLNALPERNRFIRGLRTWIGFRQIGIPYERESRNAGEVKYTFTKLMKLALDGIISFSYRPLQLIGLFGLAVSIFSFLSIAIFLFLSAFDIPVLGHSPREVPGYTTLTFAVFFLGGVQLLSLGIIGEYIGRIFDEVKQRPGFIVQETSETAAENISNHRLASGM